jgi:hypothetical protein
MKPRVLNRKQGGSIMLMVLALLAIGSLLSASFYTMLNAGLSDAYQRPRLQTAMNLADAGLEKAVASLRIDPGYAGEEGSRLGEGVFSVTATAGTQPGLWQIVSTGTFRPNGRSFHAKARVVADLQLDPQGTVLALNWREGGPCR